ncbi:unnamed protein product [Rotaria magnacalcarata]|uniref:Uncharacterized protein n=1 Tax=Rotaria magnacalcarata TaxID=392030 RepID=A0A8S2IV89_9BILA|nr:unnamed protein product [Rotaria magnacalcarata]CAF3878239.1 unnamed protein product [Rotaria magnacalcarata]
MFRHAARMKPATIAPIKFKMTPTMLTPAAAPSVPPIGLLKELIPVAIPIRPNINDTLDKPLPIQRNSDSNLFMTITNIRHPAAKGVTIQASVMNALAASNFESIERKSSNLVHDPE